MLGILQNRTYKRALAGKLTGSAPGVPLPDGGKSQKTIVRAMFAVMGRVAKVDGLVTNEEVEYASSMMQLLELKPRERQEAIDYFDLGKELDTDVLLFVEELVGNVGRRSVLAEAFLRIQCRLAYLKGGMRLKEKVLLRDVAETLGYDKAEFLQICARIDNGLDDKLHHSRQANASSLLRSAYGILQLKPDVEDGEIRRAYLKLMSRYHPDKLMQDDDSAEAMRLAQEKSTAIRNAYEAVCGYRKIRA